MKALEKRYFQCMKEKDELELKIKCTTDKDKIKDYRKRRKELIAEMDVEMQKDGIFPEFEQLVNANFHEYVTIKKTSKKGKKLFKEETV